MSSYNCTLILNKNDRLNFIHLSIMTDTDWSKSNNKDQLHTYILFIKRPYMNLIQNRCYQSCNKIYTKIYRTHFMLL